MLFVKLDKMTIKELSKKLKVTIDTLKRWIGKGDLVATKIKNPRGGHKMWFISQENLDNYLSKFNK